MSDDIPILQPGEDAPGRWVTVPGENSDRSWQGLAEWKTIHGPASVTWLFGSPRLILNARLPDGSRVAEAEKRIAFVFSDEIVMRWRDESGVYHLGTVEIWNDDVAITPTIVKPREASKSFEATLFADAEFRARLSSNDDLAQALYAALCNNTWRKGDEIYECSWRYAGGLVAELRDRGECYLDFYCSGSEGEVSAEIAAELARHGWRAED